MTVKYEQCGVGLTIYLDYPRCSQLVCKPQCWDNDWSNNRSPTEKVPLIIVFHNAQFVFHQRSLSFHKTVGELQGSHCTIMRQTGLHIEPTREQMERAKEIGLVPNLQPKQTSV
jgi:hypothetical protein